MKLTGIILFLLTAVTLAAGEVYFIPGWYSEWKNYSSHRELIQEIFPQDTIYIRKWDSNRLWKNAKNEAADFAVKLAEELESKDTSGITIIGHSLGGRIALDCAAVFARKNRQLRQIILLGAAGKISSEDIKNCQAVSRMPVINIFCVDDNMLKLFLNKEGVHPLGLAGLPHPEEHFLQYRMKVPDNHVKVFQIPVIHRSTAEPFRETAAHLSPHYLKRLQEAVKNPDAQKYIDLPALEEQTAVDAAAKDLYPGFFKIDEFDGWKLYKRKWPEKFRINSPTGRKFYFTSESTALARFAEVISAVKDQ
ncbi:MAG: DUF726 domain-containing protein [Lentisphaeria bacterium]|nr:DUF726 domain-containing protein [Lentisphaeria bacterium]